MNSVSARLACYLPKALLNWDFLDIYLTTFLGVRKLKNTSAMGFIFFPRKCLKLNFNLQKAKKIEKIFFVYEIIASGNVAINFLL